MIDKFEGEFRYLSNFYSSVVEYEGKTYKNSEAAYQSAKCTREIEKELFQDLPPNKAKQLGRRVKLRGDWEDVKDEIMYNIVYNKFLQNKDIRNKLISTDGKILIEGNWWHDNYWGKCYCNKCENRNGLNNLGKILMDIRDHFRGIVD